MPCTSDVVEVIIEVDVVTSTGLVEVVDGEETDAVVWVVKEESSDEVADTGPDKEDTGTMSGDKSPGGPKPEHNLDASL